MAVLDEIPQPSAAPQPIDIAAWTEQATAAMSAVTITAPGEAVGATTVKLAIPLDDDALATGGPVRPVGAAAAKDGGLYKRKASLRRDSMDRREALLKGKEGSRQRRRWENGTKPVYLLPRPPSPARIASHQSCLGVPPC
jgi:hypothetical protein